MTALVWAASSGEVDAARALIKAGADLNLQDTVSNNT
jgi:ankyrin repeat protein